MSTIVVLVPADGEATLMQPRSPHWTPPLHMPDVDGSVWLRRAEFHWADGQGHRFAVYTPWEGPPPATVHDLPRAAGAPDPTPAEDAWSEAAVRERHPSRRSS